MAVTELTGKKFIQVKFDATGGDWEMGREMLIRAIRVTGLDTTDYLLFYEAEGDNPMICRLDYDRPATMFQGGLFTRIGIDWGNSSVGSPANIIVSIEVE